MSGLRAVLRAPLRVPGVLAALAVTAGLVLPAGFGSAVAAPREAPRDPAAASAQERYRICMADIAVDAERALKTAQAWQKKGGGAAADHCAAASQLALGRYADAAAELDTLAWTGGAGRGPSLRASLFGQAALAWLAADQADRAAKAATQGLVLAPDDPQLLVLRARAHGQEHRFGDAVDDLNRAIGLDPKLMEAYLFRGSAFRQMGQLDRAAADLDAVLAVDQQQPEALLERGIVRRLKGEDALAKADWQALIAASPKTPAAEEARLNLEKMERGG
jgi:tetratricopeptide (TPR) repeat protein